MTVQQIKEYIATHKYVNKKILLNTADFDTPGR
jgi:hypothetical protein